MARGTGNVGKNASISITIALLIYFALRPAVTGSADYNGEAAYAVFFETLLPIGLVVADLFALFKPMM